MTNKEFRIIFTELTKVSKKDKLFFDKRYIGDYKLCKYNEETKEYDEIVFQFEIGGMHAVVISFFYNKVMYSDNGRFFTAPLDEERVKYLLSKFDIYVKTKDDFIKTIADLI